MMKSSARAVHTFCRTAGFLALKVKTSTPWKKPQKRQTNRCGWCARMSQRYINENMNTNTVTGCTSNRGRWTERAGGGGQNDILCSKCPLQSLQKSEPCWGALELKLKRALTWHILVSNCCLLSLINNGAEFELLQIRDMNLLSLSLSLTDCTMLTLWILCVSEMTFFMYHYVASFLGIFQNFKKPSSEVVQTVTSREQLQDIHNNP